jgi:hypothetical protein
MSRLEPDAFVDYDTLGDKLKASAVERRAAMLPAQPVSAADYPEAH